MTTQRIVPIPGDTPEEKLRNVLRGRHFLGLAPDELPVAKAEAAMNSPEQREFLDRELDRLNHTDRRGF